MTEHGSRVPTHEVEQCPRTVHIGQSGQARRQFTARTVFVCAQDASQLRQVGQQLARPGRGERRSEPLPVDVGDRQRDVPGLDGLPQRGDRRLRRHREHAEPPPLVLLTVDGTHSAAAPGTPGDSGGGQTQVAAVLGESVQVGVRGTVDALARAPPDARPRGEQHERVEVAVTGQLVEVACTRDLGPQHLLDLLDGDVLDRRLDQRAGRVHDNAQVGQRIEEFRQPRAVGGVAGGDRGGGP